MKTFSRISISLLLLVGFGGLSTISQASETRVDAAGGLGTILTDETNDLSLFLDGNPAGLPLLNSRSRVDLSAHWFNFDLEGPWGVNRQQGFNSLSSPGDSPVRYEGLMFFPSSQWGFQISGDISSLRGEPDANFLNDNKTASQYRGLLRAAYALSFGSFGLEMMNTQRDQKFDPGAYTPLLNLSSGSSVENQMLAKAGVAATFPSPAPADDPRWQAGAFFVFPLGVNLQNQGMNFMDGGGASYPVTQTITLTHFNLSQVELLYEVPASLKIRFSASLENTSSDFEQTVPAPSVYFNNQARFHSTDVQSLSLEGSFRYSLFFREDENLKLGGSLGLVLDNTNLFTAPGSAPNPFNQQQLNSVFGIGLEEGKEYTMGVQWKSRSYLPGSQLITGGGSPLNRDHDLYQLSLGGEKWMSAAWALRLGLTLQQDIFNPGNLNTLTTTINVGSGLERVFGRIDLRLSLGQTIDMGNSNNTAGVLGAQLSTTIFL